MSTNTTNTNNGTSNGASRPKSSAPKSAVSGEGAQLYPFASIPLPDPAMLEKLANEFFLVLPKDLANGTATQQLSSAKKSNRMKFRSRCLRRKCFRSATHRCRTATEYPCLFDQSSQPGPLTESDLRAIAASLAGSDRAGSAARPGTVRTPVPASPPRPSWRTRMLPHSLLAPTMPSGNEMFSFPGMRGSAVFSARRSASRRGFDARSYRRGAFQRFPAQRPYFMEGKRARLRPPRPVLPPINDCSLFPRVPAMPNVPGIETIPKPCSASITVRNAARRIRRNFNSCSGARVRAQQCHKRRRYDRVQLAQRPLVRRRSN